MRSNPFDEIEDVLERIGKEIEAGVGLAGGTVPIDLLDEEDEYVVYADLPGYESDEIELTLAEGRLSLSAATASDDQGRYLTRERPRGSVSRQIRLPEPVDAEGVSASYDAGVLTVRIPKERGAGSTRIDIE